VRVLKEKENRCKLRNNQLMTAREKNIERRKIK
jgi:hypothetical protein